MSSSTKKWDRSPTEKLKNPTHYTNHETEESSLPAKMYSISDRVNVNETFTQYISKREGESIFSHSLSNNRILESIDGGILNEENVRIPLSFRVRDEVYMTYKRLPKTSKRLVRAILEEVIMRVSNLRIEPRPQISINVPISVALAKVESEKEGDEVLLKRLKSIEKKLDEYRKVVKEYENEIARLRKEVVLRDRRIRELEAKLSSVSKEKIEREVIGKIKSRLYRLVHDGVITKDTLLKIFEAMGWSTILHHTKR